MTLNRLGRPRPAQDELVQLLASSPLPWTRGMLDQWFDPSIVNQINGACVNGRLWRLGVGIYTSRGRSL